MHKVNEKSAVWLTVTFFNKAGVEDTPDSISYRIDTENQEVKPSTPFTPPASTIEIMIKSEDNQIVSGFPSEIRIVTIEADFGAGDGQKIQVEYEIVDLLKIS